MAMFAPRLLGCRGTAWGILGGMDGKRGAEPASTASEREALTVRERAADERQIKANDREHLADERNHWANERERLADERNHWANERERESDLRETLLDRRQRESDERERELDERGRQLGRAVASLEQRTLETIQRSRELLEASGHRLDRQEAAVKRTEARRERQQAEVDRESAETERDLGAWLPNPSRPIERARALRKQALTAIEAFAANEEQVARVHEEIAASRPDRRDDYRRIAEQARLTARRAREILRSFTDETSATPERSPEEEEEE